MGLNIEAAERSMNIECQEVVQGHASMVGRLLFSRRRVRRMSRRPYGDVRK